jgi:very-short-patch-repair endonuclease
VLHRLDGFTPGQPELLVPRHARSHSSPLAIVRSTSRPIRATDVVTVEGFRCLRPDRLILEAPLFGFTAHETEQAIDAAVRLRLVDGQRLRERIATEVSPAVNGSRALRAAVVDAGVESWLERRFVALLRRAGLPTPELQRTYRDGTRVVARVDTFFPPDLVVELAGYRFHASRAQIQRDEQRRTELMLRGLRVITFTADDVVRRPEWVVAQLRHALSRDVAS